VSSEIEKLSDRNKTILNGAIYPAIHSCVSNRYRIVVAIALFYSVIFSKIAPDLRDPDLILFIYKGRTKNVTA